MKKGFKLIISSEFKSILKKIDSKISKHILYLNNNEDHGFSLSFIDITDKNDSISFVPINKIVEHLEIKDNYDVFWSNYRNEIRTGRFISKIMDIDPVSIELFVNAYKAEYNSFNSFDNFDIIEGEDIVKFYNGNTYVNGGGSLNKSCMRHYHCKDFFEMYKINNDKIKMLILYENNTRNKIIGRALLWKIDEPEIILLDRIYTTNDSDQRLFMKYAIHNNWYFKKTQKFDEVFFKNNFDNNEGEFITCKIYLKDINYKYFPYLDTFNFYDTKNKYLTNSFEDYKSNKHIIRLRSIDGSDQGNENFVYDIYNNDIIYVQNTIYCEIGDSRIDKRDVIKIDKIHAIPSKIRYSKYENLIYPENDVVLSIHMDSFINKKKAFKVFLDDNKKFYDYFHLDFKNKEFFFVPNKDSFFIKDLVVNKNDNYVLKTDKEIPIIRQDIMDKNYENFFKMIGEINK